MSDQFSCTGDAQFMQGKRFLVFKFKDRKRLQKQYPGIVTSFGPLSPTIRDVSVPYRRGESGLEFEGRVIAHLSTIFDGVYVTPQARDFEFAATLTGTEQTVVDLVEVTKDHRIPLDIKKQYATVFRGDKVDNDYVGFAASQEQINVLMNHKSVSYILTGFGSSPDVFLHKFYLRNLKGVCDSRQVALDIRGTANAFATPAPAPSVTGITAVLEQRAEVPTNPFLSGMNLAPGKVTFNPYTQGKKRKRNP